MKKFDPEKTLEWIIDYTEKKQVVALSNLIFLNKQRIRKDVVVRDLTNKITEYYKHNKKKAGPVATIALRMTEKLGFNEPPVVKDRSWRDKIMGRIREGLEMTIIEQDKAVDTISKLSYDYISDMSADFNPAFLMIFKLWVQRFMKYMVGSIKAKGETPNTIKKIKALMQDNTIFYMPNHVSNADHVPICYAINQFGLFHPVIAAGENLFRGYSEKMIPKLNAYKLRRDYMNKRLMIPWFDNPIYSRIHKEYTRYLWDHNEPFMFYLEGTRSRDGKILKPKTGILKDIIKHVKRTERSMYIVPVSISYTSVPEDLELEKSRTGENISDIDLFKQLYYMNKEYKHLMDSSINVVFGYPLEINRLFSRRANPEVLGGDIMQIIKGNLVAPATTKVARLIREVVNPEESYFNLDSVVDHYAKGIGEYAYKSGGNFCVNNFISGDLKVALDVFSKKKFIEKFSNGTFGVIEPALIEQYANRVEF